MVEYLSFAIIVIIIGIGALVCSLLLKNQTSHIRPVLRDGLTAAIYACTLFVMGICGFYNVVHVQEPHPDLEFYFILIPILYFLVLIAIYGCACTVRNRLFAMRRAIGVSMTLLILYGIGLYSLPYIIEYIKTIK